MATAGARAAPVARAATELEQKHRLTELSSGVRVVTESMDSVRSAALGFFIGTGSSAESEEQAGLSHLVEHMLFRGASRYTSLEIDQIFDGMGAEINAGTGKESTSVYSRVLDVHLEKAFDVMSDMVWRPRFAQEDLDQEREIVLEEIAMYEDDPQDKVFDLLGGAVFGSHPLGRAVIGHASVISGTPAAGLASFHGGRYAPTNIVVAAAGSIDHDALVAMVDAADPTGGAVSLPESSVVEFSRRTAFVERKEAEQYHVCLGGPGIARDDDRRFALRVLDNVLGGTSSSRLFQEVREKRGLAYNVFSFQQLFAGTGEVGLYVGTRPDNLATALEVIGAELARFRDDPASAEELARSKENVKGRMVLGLESTGARMGRLGGSVLAGLPILSIDEVMARIDAVTVEDLRALAVELFAAEALSVAGIGRDEALFRDALTAVAA